MCHLCDTYECLAHPLKKHILWLNFWSWETFIIPVYVHYASTHEHCRIRMWLTALFCDNVWQKIIIILILHQALRVMGLRCWYLLFTLRCASSHTVNFSSKAYEQIVNTKYELKQRWYIGGHFPSVMAECCVAFFPTEIGNCVLIP